MRVNEEEALHAGLDPREVARIARRLEHAAIDAKALGMTVFGGSGWGSLRFDDRQGPRLIVAELHGGDWDGGDGGAGSSTDGLRRGE